MTDSPNLGLPFIEAAQAQKHVTHNEAIALVDALVQIVVNDMAASAPPETPQNGERLIVGGSPAGEFAGHAAQIAYYDDGVWRFVSPKRGWLVWSLADDGPFVFTGEAWSNLLNVLGAIQNLEMLGVGATADTTNALSVRVANALFSAVYSADDGDGSLQFKLNRESSSDTISQIYQTNWSGRAETGLIGNDAWSVRCSNDGVSWSTSLIVDPLRIAAPSGSQSAPGISFIGDQDSGICRSADNTIGLVTGGSERLRVNANGFVGIGSSAPGERLVVDGNVQSLNYRIGSSSASAGTVGVMGDLGGHIHFCGSASASPDVLAFRNSGGERMRIDGGGNLLVATTNINPAQSATTGVAVRSSGVVIVSGNSTGLSMSRNGSDGYVVQIRRDASLIGGVSANTDNLAFHATAGKSITLATNDVEQVRVNAAGDVGVGTSSPSTKLQVNGPIRCGSYTRTTLPSASAVGAGAMIWVTNPASGAARSFWSNGVDWSDHSNVAP